MNRQHRAEQQNPKTEEINQRLIQKAKQDLRDKASKDKKKTNKN
jgi:hypothetical protein